MIDETLLITQDQYDSAVREAYNRGWNDCTRMTVEQAEIRLSRRAQRTSKAAVNRNADSLKGLKRLVYNTIAGNPLGLTDFDLESSTGRSHQSVSAARNSLMMAGLVTDSGKTRPNARGNHCIVWVVSSPSSKDENVHTVDPVPDPATPSPARPHIHVWTWREVRADSGDHAEVCRECGATR